jgi:hypothetical protein
MTPLMSNFWEWQVGQVETGTGEEGEEGKAAGNIQCNRDKASHPIW